MSSDQLTIDVLLTDGEHELALADQARIGLTSDPKWLSPVWFYDETGSELFDEITRLPEYYLTRAERSLLTAHSAEIATACRAETLVELGSGTCEKTRLLLDAMAATGDLRRYVPFDVSTEMLRSAAEGLAVDYRGLEVHGVVGDFHHHLGALPGGGRRLVAFLGSTIGNFAPEQRRRFFFDLDCAMTADDRLLLGADLVKEPARLLAAYNDSAGVTARFNRNALLVLNKALGADFDVDLFDHEARWNADAAWMEMHLRARRAHRVQIDDLDIAFAAGETVRTEISAKFTEEGLTAELSAANFVVERVWRAREGFMLVLARPYC